MITKNQLLVAIGICSTIVCIPAQSSEFWEENFVLEAGAIYEYLDFSSNTNLNNQPNESNEDLTGYLFMRKHGMTFADYSDDRTISLLWEFETDYSNSGDSSDSSDINQDTSRFGLGFFNAVGDSYNPERIVPDSWVFGAMLDLNYSGKSQSNVSLSPQLIYRDIVATKNSPEYSDHSISVAGSINEEYDYANGNSVRVDLTYRRSIGQKGLLNNSHYWGIRTVAEQRLLDGDGLSNESILSFQILYRDEINWIRKHIDDPQKHAFLDVAIGYEDYKNAFGSQVNESGKFAIVSLNFTFDARRGGDGGGSRRGGRTYRP